MLRWCADVMVFWFDAAVVWWCDAVVMCVYAVCFIGVYIHMKVIKGIIALVQWWRWFGVTVLCCRGTGGTVLRSYGAEVLSWCCYV